MPESLPSGAKKLWEQVYDASKKAGDDEEKAARKAWGALKKAGWSKNAEGKWVKQSLAEFSFYINKVGYNEETEQMYWRATTSDTSSDLANDNTTLELFTDFLSRIKSNALAPDEYRSDFWSGGMPYVSISHYPDLNGDAVPGEVTDIYIDGEKLKAKGIFHDTPLGRACWNSIKADFRENKAQEDRVRVSIGFLDYGHKHKSNDYNFVRQSEDEWCPECLKEILKDEFPGKVFLRGLLVHLAMTRSPMNVRTTWEVDNMTTRAEDAASIVGEELAEEIAEKAGLKTDKAALVIKSDDETQHILKSLLDELQALKADIAELKMSDKKKEEEKEDMEDEEEDEEEMKKKSDFSDPVADVLKALTEQNQAMLQKFDVLIAANTKTKSNEVPERRSIDPSLAVPRANYDPGKPVSLKSLARRSAGLVD